MSTRSGRVPASRLPPPRTATRAPAPPPSELPAREAVREDFRDEVAPEVVSRPARVRRRPIRASVRSRSTGRAPSRLQLVRRLLSTPGTARQAFVVHEVLGPPVSLRTGAPDRPI